MPVIGGTGGSLALTGDLGGTSDSPQVVGTHLATPLPVAQGGTGAASAAAARTALGVNAIPSNVVTRTTTYTATPGDLVLADATAAGFTVTLPGSATAGQMVSVKKTDGSPNTIVVLPPSGTIDGDASATILTKYAGGVFQFDGANWRVVSVMLGSSVAATNGILGYVSYSPAAAITTASATPVDLDAANLAVTFTAPSTGRVIVDLEAYLDSGTASNGYGWALRDSGGLVAGTNRSVTFGAVTVRVPCRIVVTGLTPGQSYTWKWAHYRITGAGNPGIFSGGTGTHHATMTVSALP